MKEENEIEGFTFDKILYWRIVNSHCCEVKRDRKWFAEKYPLFKAVWEKIAYLRMDKEAGEAFRERVLKQKEENKARYGRKNNNDGKMANVNKFESDEDKDDDKKGKKVDFTKSLF